MRLDELKTLWPEIEPLLDELLELDEPARAHLLDRVTAGSPETRRVLEALLRADQEAGARFEHPPISPESFGTLGSAGANVEPGARFGPYAIRRELGRGGMGTVLLAERDDGQFSQQVAIKLMRSDAWSPGARERFVQERRILARLEHPHIARLFDGGLRDDGTPYLVMEYVEGQPITEWCDVRRLNLRGRILLFRQVCEAVEYAHRQLVVHRDLKPDNIFVTESGEVKLLDFGIAKLLEPSGAAAMTGTQARVFTPAYATPEQYLGGPLTVAADEYQLGLVLYELFTGQRAHGDGTSSPLALQRRVLEVDPARPSRCVARTTATPPAAGSVSAARDSAPAPGDGRRADEIAAARGTTPEGLARALGGDLDAIVLRALERQPEQRYASVEALRRDLEHHLDDRPVAARHATTGYRMRKYARRHRVALVAGALIALSLIAGLTGVLMQARIAAHQRDLARESERKATAINEFVLRELLESPTPERALGRPLTVAEVLASASRTVGHAFAGQPETEAAVRMTLARSYQALGKLDEARAHAEIAQRLLASRPDRHARESLEARALMGSLALDQGRYEEAQTTYERLLADQARVLGASDPATLQSEGELGRVLMSRGSLLPADSLLRHALGRLPPPGDTPWRLAVGLRGSLAAVRLEQGHARESEALIRQSLVIERRHLGEDHPLVVASLRQLANALDKDLRPAEAGAVLDTVLRVSLKIYGEHHPATGDAYLTITVNRAQQMRTDEAVEAINHAVVIYRSTLGVEHPKTLRALRNQAVFLRAARRFPEADLAYEEVYQTCLRTLGAEHSQTIEALNGLQLLRLDEGRTAEARMLTRRTIATYERIAARPDADPTMLANFAQYLVEVDPADLRDPHRAVAIARRAVEITQHKDYFPLRALGFAQDAAGDGRGAITSLSGALALPEGVRSWSTEEMLVQVLRKVGAPGELERVLLKHLADERAIRGESDRYIAKTLRHLSHYYQSAGSPADAERYARESLTQLLKTLPPSHWEVGRAQAELGALLVSRAAYGEAESLLVQGYRTLEADPEIPRSQLESTRQQLVTLYRNSQRANQALAWSGHVIARPPDVQR